MYFSKLSLIFLVVVIFGKTIIWAEHDKKSEHENYNDKTQDKYFTGDSRDSYDIHSFNQDQHQEDSNYDEDVLTGTSHHEQRNQEQTKKAIEELFQKMDKSNDTKLERDELLSHLIISMKQLHNESTEDEFVRVDTNKDKKVSLDEFSIYEHHNSIDFMDNLTNSDNSTKSLDLKKIIQHEKDRFKAADNNTDGFLNEHEYMFFKYPVFFPHMAHTIIHDYIEDLDSNDDGTVDKKEYIDHFHISDNKDKIARDKSLKRAEEDFIRYDKDKNGIIDVEEYHAILKPGYEEAARSEADYLFNESDSNKDGKLTLKEIERHSHAWLGSEPLDPANQEDDDGTAHHLDDEL